MAENFIPERKLGWIELSSMVLEVCLAMFSCIVVARQSGKWICVCLRCVCLQRKDEPECRANPFFASSLAVSTWGGCRWMGHKCGGCLALSLQQHLRVQEMTFAQSPHYSPDAACLSVPALSLLSPSTKNWLSLPLHLMRRCLSPVHRCVC